MNVKYNINELIDKYGKINKLYQNKSNNIENIKPSNNLNKLKLEVSNLLSKSVKESILTGPTGPTGQTESTGSTGQTGLQPSTTETPSEEISVSKPILLYLMIVSPII